MRGRWWRKLPRSFLDFGLAFDSLYVGNGVPRGTANVDDGNNSGSAHPAQFHQATLPAGPELLRGEEFGYDGCLIAHDERINEHISEQVTPTATAWICGKFVQ
jgi:hypothetical protein